MKTILLNPNTDPTAVAQAAALLRAGEVVGIPTETVYGLGADALNGKAVRRIFEAKGRPTDNPLIVHIADFDQIYDLVREVPAAARALADAYWPGPMTIILPKAACIPDEVSCGLDTVGIRLPVHPLAREIIRAAGTPIAAPSANTSGRPSTTTAAHVMEDMDGRIAAVVDGGACAVGVESTVISLAGDKPRLLRPGGISLEQLQAVLGEVVVDRALREKIGDDEKVSAPGMKYRHYAPRAAVTAFTGDPAATAARIAAKMGAKTGIICYDEYAAQFAGHPVRTIGSAADSLAHAQHIFDALRWFDEVDGVEEILAQCPPDTGVDLAVANRLKKAAGFRIEQV